MVHSMLFRSFVVLSVFVGSLLADASNRSGARVFADDGFLRRQNVGSQKVVSGQGPQAGASGLVGGGAGRERADMKLAFLIANGDYAHFGKLADPVRDMEGLATVLKQLGFEVMLLRDASKRQMVDGLLEFEGRLRRSGGIGFFHYGGHGVQVGGRNYLIPVDAEISDESRVVTRALDVEEVTSSMEQSGARASIVVLDACRDNPLPRVGTRGATRGLAAVERRPKNSVIVYAADAGCSARDGVFTPALSRHLRSTDLTLSQVLTKVRKEVFEETKGQQSPGSYNQLFEEIYLVADLPSGLVGSGREPVGRGESEVPMRRESLQPRVNEPEPMSSELEMRRPIEEVFAAWRSLDLQRYISQWAPQAMKIDMKTGKRYSVQDLFRERQRDFPRFRQVYAEADIRLRNADARSATFDVWYDMSFVGKTGKRFRDRAKESYDVRKVGDRWMIEMNRDYEAP